MNIFIDIFFSNAIPLDAVEFDTNDVPNEHGGWPTDHMILRFLRTRYGANVTNFNRVLKVLKHDKFDTPTYHEYEIETNKGYVTTAAYTRDHAARIASRAGYEVYSVNFTG